MFRCYAGFTLKEAKEGMGVLFTDKVSCNSNLRYTHQTHFSVMVCVNWQEEVKKQYLKDLTLGIIRKKL